MRGHIAYVSNDPVQAYKDGYAAGLDAAREAVTRTCHHTKYDGCRPCSHDTAAAAIDALRGDR